MCTTTWRDLGVHQPSSHPSLHKNAKTWVSENAFCALWSNNQVISVKLIIVISFSKRSKIMWSSLTDLQLFLKILLTSAKMSLLLGIMIYWKALRWPKNLPALITSSQQCCYCLYLKKKKVKISNPYLISSQCHEVVVSSVFSIITLCSFLEIFVVHDFSTVLHNKLIPGQQLQFLIEWQKYWGLFLFFAILCSVIGPKQKKKVKTQNYWPAKLSTDKAFLSWR